MDNCFSFLPGGFLLKVPGDNPPQLISFLLVLFFLLLVISFIISGAQSAYFALGKKDLDMLQSKTNPSYKRILRLLEDPSLLFSTLFIANILFNIALIILSNTLLNKLFSFENMAYVWLGYAIKIIAISFLLLLFCETLPKRYARHHPIRFARDMGFIVSGVFSIFKTFGSWMLTFTNPNEKKNAKRSFSNYSSDELEAVMENNPETTASDQEKNILKGILKFTNISVKQIMRPRPDVSGVEYSSTFTTLQQKIEELHYSRIPIYKNDLDDIAGIIHTKDVLSYLTEKEDFDWHTIMRLPFFVHEQKMIVELLKEFQQKRVHFAIVVDEFGGTSGIVTMEDILEEIMGDIKDEFDEEETGIRRIDDHNFIFEGRTMIYDVCKYLNIPLNTFDEVKGESGSLGGLVLELAGHMPQKDEKVTSGDFLFTTLEADKTRLLKIKITIENNARLT
ncbi:MAG: gliding motility-associated protein GldE [Bacteroidetes bacterium]|nr:gliding motility-associated protein GldE [Bacteroidota bacterium]